ncbi:MAG: DUF4199 domain-containing protein [Bacteroidales bacterium]|jgi:uncharacterized membrane protein
MEQKSTSSFAAAIMPGIYLGVALIVFRLILFLLDVDMESWLNWTIYIVLAIGIFWGMVNFRDKYREGIISYGGAFSSGFAIGLFASVIMGVFTYIFVAYIDTTLIDQVMLKAEEGMLSQNPDITDEQLDQALSMVKKFTSPADGCYGVRL